MAQDRISRRALLRLGALSGAAGIAGTTAVVRAHAAEPSPRFHLGTYTDAGGPGIATGRLDPATGRLVVTSWNPGVTNPSWLALGPGGATLYAVSESTAGQAHALRVAAGDQLSPVSAQATGDGPAHAAVHPDGTFLITAMYGGGTVAVHPLAPDGAVQPVTHTVTHGRGAHPHQVVFAPDGVVLVVDLGLHAVVAYALDAVAGTLTETGRTVLPRTPGPRHLAFHPDGRHAYVANELASNVTVGRYANGALSVNDKDEPVSTLPAGTTVRNYPGGIVAAPDGRHVYVSNRGHNSVAVFATERDGAALRRVATPSCDGDWPRDLALDPAAGRLYVANQRSGDVTWFPLTDGVPGPAAGRLPAVGVARILFAPGA